MSRRSPLRLAVSAALVLTPALAPLAMASAPASAALPQECTQASATADVVCVYNGVGEHTFLVPAGVTSVRVTAVGGKGGQRDSTKFGGRGAQVNGTLSVDAGSTLYAEVGGNGGDSTSDGNGGYNGGGNGHFLGPNLGTSPAGGGASDIRTSKAADQGSLATRRLVAAGGGGSGDVGNGGDADTAGATSAHCQGGKPAVAAVGGLAGTCDNTSPTGDPGQVGRGGDAHDGYGSGGGGGLAGGGAGSGRQGDGSGGGGGSSMVPVGGTSTLSTDRPSVTIIYTPRTTTISPATATLVAGRSLQFSAKDGDGNDVTATTQFAIAPDGSCNQVEHTCTATKAGKHTVTATPYIPPAPRPGARKAAAAAQPSNQAIVTVVHAAATKLKLDPATASIPSADSQRYRATGTDRFGNTFDATSGTKLTISGSGTCKNDTCSPGTAGKHTVTATRGTGAGALTATATLTGTSVSTAAATTTGSTSTTGALPDAGAPAGMVALLLAGLAMLATGSGLVLSQLRRRQRTAAS